LLIVSFPCYVDKSVCLLLCFKDCCVFTINCTIPLALHFLYFLPDALLIQFLSEDERGLGFSVILTTYQEGCML